MILSISSMHKFHSWRPGGFSFDCPDWWLYSFAQMLVNDGELDGARILKPETIKLMATNLIGGQRYWAACGCPAKGERVLELTLPRELQHQKHPMKKKNGAVGWIFGTVPPAHSFWLDPKKTDSGFVRAEVSFDNDLHKKIPRCRIWPLERIVCIGVTNCQLV